MTKLGRFLVALLVLGGLAGCGSDQAVGMSREAQLALDGTSETREGEFLAYEHTIVVDTSEAGLEKTFHAVIESCAADRENACSVLHSEINHGDYNRASIRMRVKPEGVAPLATLAAGEGKVIRRSTHAEDLAMAITDNEKRIAILTTTRDRLLELEDRGSEDVESLIRITTELTRVQAELEEAAGLAAYQRQRVDLDILNIDFVVEAGRSFWAPVGNSVSSFGRNLSDGLADTIQAVAYLLPWSILVLIVVYLLRKLWKRTRSSSR